MTAGHGGWSPQLGLASKQPRREAEHEAQDANGACLSLVAFPQHALNWPTKTAQLTGSSPSALHGPAEPCLPLWPSFASRLPAWRAHRSPAAREQHGSRTMAKSKTTKLIARSLQLYKRARFTAGYTWFRRIQHEDLLNTGRLPCGDGVHACMPSLLPDNSPDSCDDAPGEQGKRSALCVHKSHSPSLVSGCGRRCRVRPA